MKHLKYLALTLVIVLLFVGCDDIGMSFEFDESAQTTSTNIDFSKDGKTSLNSKSNGGEIAVITKAESDESYEWLYDSIESAEQKKYTVLVYMNGSDLESKWGCATGDLKEMIDSGFNEKNLNVLVLTGGTDDWKNTEIKKETSIYQLTKDGVQQLVDFGECSIADTGLLTAYVNYGMQAFPADRYGFVFWNHGGGSIYGYGSDELFGGQNMGIDEIELAFSDSDMYGEPFEFIGFDCCLMATIEMAYLLEPYTNYLIASEELEPGQGWDYSWLKDLSANPKYSGAQIGKVIVDKFVNFYAKTGEEATLSVIDVYSVADLVNSYEYLMETAGEAVQNGEFNTISKARKGTKSFGYTGEGRFNFDIVDIKHFAEQLSEDYPDEAIEVMDSVDSVVTYFKSSQNVKNANGISAYIPYASKEYAPNSIKKCDTLGLMPESVVFLDAFSKTLNGEKATRSTIPQAKPVVEEEKVSIQLDAQTLEDINKITFTIWRQWEEDSDYFIKLGLSSDVEIEDDGTISTMFDGYWATLGGQTACFYEVEKFDDTEKYSTPAVLNGEDVDLIVIFDKNYPDGHIVGALPAVTDAQDAKLAPKYMIPIESGDTLALKYFAQLFLSEGQENTYDENSMWVTGDEFVVEKDLKIEIVPVDDELYLYGFWIEDVQNNNYYTDFVEIRY